MADELMDQVIEREGAFNDMWNRQDKDEDMYLLEDYEFTRADDSEYDNAFSVTRNTPQAYAHAIQGDLAAAKIIPEVTSIDDKEDTSNIESFLKDMRHSVNEWSTMIYGYPLDKFNNEGMTVRGSIATRIMFEVNADGELIPGAMNCDTRYLTWDYDNDGSYSWVCSRGKLSRAELLRDFGTTQENKDKIKNALGKDKDGEYRDVWTNKNHVLGAVHNVYINEELVIGEANQFGYPPFVIQPSLLGATIMTKKKRGEHWGESIYWPNRDEYVDQNRIASLSMNIAMESWRAPVKMLGYEPGEMPVAIDKPPKRAGGSDGDGDVEMVSLPGGTEISRLYPLEDMKNAVAMVDNMLEGDTRKAAFSNLDMGDLEGKELSAVAISNMSEKKGRIVTQLTEPLSMYWSKFARMVINQMIEGNISAPLGVQGRRNTYKGSELAGDYAINYTYRQSDAGADIAAYAVAPAARDAGMDQLSILRDIVKAQDPEQIMRLRAIEDIKKVSPVALKLYTARAAVEEGDDALAKILAKELKMDLTDIVPKTQPQQSPVQQIPQQMSGNNAMMPRLPKAGAGQLPRMVKSKLPKGKANVQKEGVGAKEAIA